MIKKQNKILFIAGLLMFLAVLITLAIFWIKSSSKTENPYNFSENTVVRIIDGDTFELFNGDIIRLICVDSPEKAKEGYEEATDFLASLILYKELKLEKDIDDKDKYGRLLRYVYVNITENNEEREIFVNKEIIKNNYGTLFLYGNNTAKCGEIGNEKNI